MIFQIAVVVAVLLQQASGQGNQLNFYSRQYILTLAWLYLLKILMHESLKRLSIQLNIFQNLLLFSQFSECLLGCIGEA